MKPWTRRAAIAGAVVWLAAAGGYVVWSRRREHERRFRSAKWDELLPPGWDPMAQYRAKNLDRIKDTDPQSQALLKEMRETWDNAPTRTELDGTPLRLPGYVVPLEQSLGKVREFLLVPYYGACIHTPPPPANQIVHVVLAEPTELDSMAAVWVSGTLSAQRKASWRGASGYGMQGAEAVPYHPEDR